MGTDYRLRCAHLLFTAHPNWPALGFSGAAYGEWDRLACGWDDCVPLGPDAAPALYVAFPGGRVGEGPYLFAGEQTSSENIGFLDGAVETGEDAATALLRMLR